MDEAELERGITLLRACWAFFDGVAARVSPEMRKGPRGGGRDREQIVRHAIRTESEYFAKQVGLRTPERAALAPDGLRRHREAYVAAMRAYNAGQVKRRMRSWTLRSSSGTPPSTRSTTRGRSRTRTSPPGAGPDHALPSPLFVNGPSVTRRVAVPGAYDRHRVPPCDRRQPSLSSAAARPRPGLAQRVSDVNTDYHRPRTLDEALALAAGADAVILGGGTTVNARPGRPPSVVVDLQALDLDGIEMDGGSTSPGGHNPPPGARRFRPGPRGAPRSGPPRGAEHDPQRRHRGRDRSERRIRRARFSPGSSRSARGSASREPARRPTSRSR